MELFCEIVLEHDATSVVRICINLATGLMYIKIK